MLKRLVTVLSIVIIGVGLYLNLEPDVFSELQLYIAHGWDKATNALQMVKSETATASTILRSFNTKNQRLGILTVDDIIDETNKQRIANNLSPLKKNEKLDESAKLKVDDMVANHYFEHTSPSGKTVSDLGDEVGYSYIVMGENLALGNFASAQELVQAWMNSPGHRANILNANYQDIGVYAAIGTYEGHTVWFAVQHFGTQKAVCPSISSTLKKSIQTVNDDLTKREQVIVGMKQELEAPNAQYQVGYAEKVNTFNGLVSAYNSIVAISKQRIADYNTQVAAFNKCLSQFQ